MPGVLQGAVVYLNTLMIQDVLDEGLAELSPDDLRGLIPLFWTNIAPYLSGHAADSLYGFSAGGHQDPLADGISRTPRSRGSRCPNGRARC